MKLTIHDSAWAVVSENAKDWHDEYLRDMNMPGGLENTVDILYVNRCYDQANRMRGGPVPLDEMIILLDRFWAKECEAAKTAEFRERVKSLIARYDEVAFESSGGGSAENEPDGFEMPVTARQTDEAPVVPQNVRPGEIYGHGTDVEVLTPYALRLSILGSEPDPALAKILLDPVQARKLMRNLEIALAEYETDQGRVGEEYTESPGEIP